MRRGSKLGSGLPGPGPRRGAAVAVAVLVLAACTSAPPSADAPAGQDRPAQDIATEMPVLLATTEVGDVAIDGASGALLAGGPGTVATPGGDTMYRATAVGGDTVVSSLDPRTGATVTSTRLTGDLELAIASVSGDALALVQPAPGAPSGSLPGRPVPRAFTPIVVADPRGQEPPARYRLEGNFEPEAFSIDDERLYLIQYLPAEAPAVYRVTVLDTATGEVRPVTGRFKSPPERMPGVRLGQVYDPQTSQMYTLYSNQPGAYAQGYEHAGGTSHDWPEETFVHVLNLRKGWAYCAGVPKSMWGGTAREQSLAPSPDGRWLYIVDARQGTIAVMNTRTLDVERTARVDLATTGDAGRAGSMVRTSVAVSRDGDTLFVASGASPGTVTAIDVTDMTIAGRWPSPLPVSGLGLSLDGSGLYVAGDGRIALFDLGTGRTSVTVPTPLIDPIVGVDPLPVAGLAE
ncbi:MAG TPA: hypothetical protein VNC60_09340 [Actinomycetota bacterium]|nr:hypothetical protein [Actinomycetota bacterium]